MAAFFIDLDGTVLKHGTNDPLPGAIDFLKKICDEGHDIYFTTKRGREFEKHPVYSQEGCNQALRMFDREGITYKQILFGVESPRIVVNDDGAFCINLQRDNPQYPDFNRILEEAKDFIWTEDQVNSLNEFQRNGPFHPFTCTCGNSTLVATRKGWVCPLDCGYKQFDAHGWMMDWSWKKHSFKNIGKSE